MCQRAASGRAYVLCSGFPRIEGSARGDDVIDFVSRGRELARNDRVLQADGAVIV